MSKSKTLLITGCSSGIGEAAAQQMRARGYQVFTTARQPEDVARLQAQGFAAHLLDLDDSASIEAALDWLWSQTQGELYGLFNNAAYGQPGAVEDLSREVLRAQFETNLFGTHELTTRVLPVMRRQGYGRIVQNSSVLGLVAMKYRGAYNASKFALEGLTDTLRLELDGSGVFVSLIEPGPIVSRFRDNAYAKLKANIVTQGSAHEAVYAAVEKRLANQDPAQQAPFTLGPEAVVKALIHALEASRPKVRYAVTTPTYLLGGLKRLLSSRALDRVLLKIAERES